MKKYSFLVLTLFALQITPMRLSAQSAHQLHIQTNKLGARIKSTMYGLFFEDINFGADGGLYAELIKNRSFEFPQSFMGWDTFGNVELLTEKPPFEKNPHYVRLKPANHIWKQTGLENNGFKGIGLKENASYTFSVWGRKLGNTDAGKIRVELIDTHNRVLLKQEMDITSGEWKKYSIVLKSTKKEEHAKLRIYLASNTGVELDHISLFPVETWKNRENGLRKDLVQALYDLKPGVFRFPGGCIVEGTDIDTRYDWKKSIGPVENRPLNENRWNYTFPHRLYPDYFQTYGMGFFELFLLSEDLGAEPLPIVNCGLSCQYQNSMSGHVPLSELDRYVQDALDLIEFANGDVQTKWGGIRASMGHPAPFNLKMIGVGNEQWGPEYVERLEVFLKAIRKAHPEIKIVGSSGPQSEGKEFDYLWPEMRKLKVDLVDEHYYRGTEWFLNNAGRYDKYPRQGSKVFAGEYACHAESKTNTFYSALCEAAFMTGLERNADVVQMATYAPLLAHVDGWQWSPDLIWFNNLTCLLTPNYYVQQLYGRNPGTHVLPLTLDKKAVTGQHQLYASAVFDANTKSYIIKIANVAESEQEVTLVFKGLPKKQLIRKGICYQLQSPSRDAENTFENPNLIVPMEKAVNVQARDLTLKLAPLSFTVLKLQ